MQLINLVAISAAQEPLPGCGGLPLSVQCNNRRSRRVGHVTWFDQEGMVATGRCHEKKNKCRKDVGLQLIESEVEYVQHNTTQRILCAAE